MEFSAVSAVIEGHEMYSPFIEGHHGPARRREYNPALHYLKN